MGFRGLKTEAASLQKPHRGTDFALLRERIEGKLRGRDAERRLGVAGGKMVASAVAARLAISPLVFKVRESVFTC